MSAEEKKSYIQFMLYLYRHIIVQMYMVQMCTDGDIDYFRAVRECIICTPDWSGWRPDGVYARKIISVRHFLLERNIYGSPKDPEDILQYIQDEIMRVLT